MSISLSHAYLTFINDHDSLLETNIPGDNGAGSVAAMKRTDVAERSGPHEKGGSSLLLI